MPGPESPISFEITPERKIVNLDHALTHAGRALGELEMTASNIPIGSTDSPALDTLVANTIDQIDAFVVMLQECEEPLTAVMADASIKPEVKQRFQNALNHLKERGQKVWEKIPEIPMFNKQ